MSVPRTSWSQALPIGVTEKILVSENQTVNKDRDSFSLSSFYANHH